MGNVVMDFETRTSWIEDPIFQVEVDWPESADDFARGHTRLALQSALGQFGLRFAISRFSGGRTKESRSHTLTRARDIRKIMSSCQAGIGVEFFLTMGRP